MDQNLINRAPRMNRTSRRVKKTIKRYGNRKLYDTEQSSYVVLNDIAKMIRNEENILIIDNETKEDITSSTLTQIIFNAERNAVKTAPLSLLKAIIKAGDGSFSSYLSKGALRFKAQIQDPAIHISEDKSKVPQGHNKIKKEIAPPPVFQHKTLQERVVSAALSPDSLPSSETTILPTSQGNITEK